MDRLKMYYLFVLLAAVFSCANNHKLSMDEIKKLPEKKLESHDYHLTGSIEKRISAVPPLILDYLKKMDSTDKYSAYELTPDEKKLFLDYYELLPRKYREITVQKVVAIYFIKNFIGGGMADYCFDKNGNMLSVLYFNPEILHTTLTDWINFRDNATFTEDGSTVTVKSDCGKKYFGLLHTIIHETSHIYDYYYYVTPYPEFDLVTGRPNSTPFIEGVWRNFGEPLPVYDFPGRKNISTYGLGNKSPRASAVNLYISLNKTPFASLYGTCAWMDDFAESFTWYYIRTKLNTEYTVTVYKDGKEAARFNPAENELVRSRYKQFELLVD